MLARGTGPEVGPGHKNAGTLVSVLIEDEVGLVGPPGGEESVLEAGAGDALEVDGGNDLMYPLNQPTAEDLKVHMRFS